MFEALYSNKSALPMSVWLTILSSVDVNEVPMFVMCSSSRGVRGEDFHRDLCKHHLVEGRGLPMQPYALFLEISFLETDLWSALWTLVSVLFSLLTDCVVMLCKVDWLVRLSNLRHSTLELFFYQHER